MTADANRQGRKRRLERAGYVAVVGWLPATDAAEVMAQVETHREAVERISQQPPLPRGRPPKGTRDE